MKNIYLLGSGSGVYPDYHRRYTSWILEENSGNLLLFDVGPGSAEASYCLGINPLRLKNIFITHAHLDHTAGLPALMMIAIKKMWDTDEFANKRDIHFYSPCAKIIDGTKCMVDAEFASDTPVHFIHHELNPGVVFIDDEVVIDCIPTLHRDYVDGKPVCYGYRIKSEDGRTIVYTGDFADIMEFSAWLEDGCDLLLLETGHHRAVELAQTIRANRWKVKKLFFIHHGLAMLNDMVEERRQAEAAWGDSVIIGQDSMVIPLDFCSRLSPIQE